MESTLEALAIKAAMTMPALLLQKSHPKSKFQDHVTCLHPRFALWEVSKIEEVVKEGKSIQRHLSTLLLSTTNNEYVWAAQKFSNLMMKGKVKAALRLLKVAQAKQKHQYDKRSKETRYQPGDRVMVLMSHEQTGKNRNLTLPYYGPYQVLEALPHGLHL